MTKRKAAPAMKGMPIGKKIRVSIEGFDDEGRGRGIITNDSSQDVDVAVRGAFPGDHVECIIERVFAQRGLVQARLSQVIYRGHARGERLCAHRAPCAGCPLEGALPSFALSFRQERIRQALESQQLDVSIEDVITHPSGIYHPRQKVKWAISGYPGHLVMGLYAPRSHRVIDSTLCPYTDAQIVDVAPSVLAALNQMNIPSSHDDPKGVKAIVLRHFKEGVICVAVVGAPLTTPRWKVLERLVDEGILFGIGERVDASEGNSVIGGTIARSAGQMHGTPISGGPQETPDAFCQPSAEFATKLYTDIARFLTYQSPPDAWYVDAYAGTGGFSRALVEDGAEKVIAVERSKENIQPEHRGQVHWIQASVEDSLSVLKQSSSPFGVVADPPRKGLGEDAIGLAKLDASRFVLVSCDPDAMAKDVKRLTEYGYKVVQMIPYDFFAGTHQIETVVLLEKE